MSEAAILLVDDEKLILDSLKEQLRMRFGGRFVYETAENVDEAWEVFDELESEGTSVVVVVSDWLMPGVRGDEFLEEVWERWPAVVRIMLTGQADESALERARSSHVHRILHKPWRAEELAGAILTGLGSSAPIS
ncbi:MAG: response regulator [Polyangiaceae bacterium]